jgi:hypothetical protein
MNSGDLINSSLRLIGALASGEVPTSNEQADGLTILNQMIDAWNAERLNIFTITIGTFPLVILQQVYTLGPGGNFNVTRPARVDRISIISLNNPAQPLELPMTLLTDEQWRDIPVKNVSSALPLKVYDDGAYPLRNLSLWPIPSATANIAIYGWTALTAFPDTVTDEEFPPGYFEALRYNLAMRMAPEFGLPLRPEVAAMAMSSKAIIKGINIIPLDSYCDSAITQRGGRYNWISDQGA